MYPKMFIGIPQPARKPIAPQRKSAPNLDPSSSRLYRVDWRHKLALAKETQMGPLMPLVNSGKCSGNRGLNVPWPGSRFGAFLHWGGFQGW